MQATQWGGFAGWLTLGLLGSACVFAACSGGDGQRSSAGSGGSASTAGQGGSGASGLHDGGHPHDGGPKDAGPEGTCSYPRIGALQWGGSNADWLGRFQLVITSPNDTAIAAEIKQAHPDAMILWTTDWNAGGPFSKNYVGPGPLPSEWRLKTSAGVDIPHSAGFFADITEFCQPYTGTVNEFTATAERYNEALPRYIDEKTDWSTWDGVNSDGSWEFPGNEPDIDLDRNHMNDYDETSHGATPELRKAWIHQKWWEGQDATRKSLRDRFAQRLGDKNAKLINYWTIGGGTDAVMSIDYTNGVGWENMYWNWPVKFADWPPLIKQWEEQGPAPRVNYVSGDLFYDAVNAPLSRRKDYFRLVRWFLATALLNDVYFLSGDLQNHHWNNYYDEYDVKLGQPKGPAVALADGAWARFFDHGAVLVNPTNETLTIADADLHGLKGYAGPYHHFQGNQDSAWNDGSAFVSDIFKSSVARGISDDGTEDPVDHVQNVGDGLILVDAPSVVVAEIIVDNAYSGTSPGSIDTTLDGFTPDLDAGYSKTNPAWTAAIRYNKDARYYVSDTAPGVTGAPTATAVYRPGIHVAGKYRVYEWHGWAGSDTDSKVEAANVPVKVVHAGGTASLVIDETKGYGRWNELGTYSFQADGSAKVTLTNDVGCSGCTVVADAFKFVYVPED